MDTVKNPYLIPVYIKPRKVGDSTLNYRNLQDITFDKFFDFFFRKLNDYTDSWKWLHARHDAVVTYALDSLLGFCHDPLKIRATQEMLYTFMLEDRLQSFILDPAAPFDKWADNTNGDHGIKMLTSLETLVSRLHDELGKVQDSGKRPLDPFISYVAELNSSELMKNIREFISIFDKPVEFSFLIASYEGKYGESSFNEFKSMLEQYRNNPEGSYNRTEKMRYGIYVQEVVATFFDGDKKILIEERDYMQGMEDSKEPHCFIGVKKSFLIELLGLNHEDFLGEFMPDSNEPLKMTLRIEKLEGGEHKISTWIEEPSEDVVLEYVPSEYKKTYGHTHAKMISRMRNSNDKPKAERTKVQNALFGKTKSVVTRDELAYEAKVRYFNFFFGQCSEFMREDFGRKLGELRYLAFVAKEFLFIKIFTNIVFPKILAVDDQCVEIVDAVNPTLILDPEGKSEIIPNTIEINDRYRIQMITGPNQNGKSRFVDSVGLNQILFQAGWPVFAKSAQISPMTDLRNRYVHSGVGILGESRFSNECGDVFKDFAESKGAYPVFLIDEPYTGTNYLDAEQLLKELLLACSEENVTVFLTTHFHGLIDFIEELSNGRNLHCVVEDDGVFTYKIREGSSTKSNALVVAEKAGVRYGSLKAILKKKKTRNKITGEFDSEEVLVIEENTLPETSTDNNQDDDSDDLPF